MSGPQPAHKITPAWYCLLAFVSIIAGGIFPLTGCKTMGYLFKDFASKKSVPAAFQLTHDPLLILVDDDQEWCTWAGGRDHLTEQIAKSLNESGANTKSIPVSQINSIRPERRVLASPSSAC